MCGAVSTPGLSNRVGPVGHVKPCGCFSTGGGGGRLAMWGHLAMWCCLAVWCRLAVWV